MRFGTALSGYVFRDVYLQENSRENSICSHSPESRRKRSINVIYVISWPAIIETPDFTIVVTFGGNINLIK